MLLVVCRSAYLSVCLPVCLCVWQAICWFVCLAARLLVNQLCCVFVCFFVCCLFVSLCVGACVCAPSSACPCVSACVCANGCAVCRCQVLGLGCAMCLVFCWCVVAADVLLLWAMWCRPSTSLWGEVAIGPTCRYFFHWAFDGPGFFAWGLPPGVPGEASPTQKIPGLPRISFVPYTQLHTVHKIGPAGLLK